MLHEKLEQASKDAKKIRFANIGMLALIALFTALLAIGGTVYFDPPAPQIEAGVSTPKVGPNPLARKSSPEQPKDNHAVSKSPTQNRALPPEQKKFFLDEAKNSKARDEFKSAIKSFTQNIGPKVLSESFRNWNKEVQSDILFLKDAAVSSFGSGDYPIALALLTKASEIAQKNLIDLDNAFDRNTSKAKLAHDRDEFDLADFEIKKALRLKPLDPNGLKLAVRIAILPEILKKINAAKIARTENNIQAEYKNLLQVLKLDPSRKNFVERATFLKKEIKERTFSKHISSGFSYANNRNLKGSVQNLQTARRLFSNREEISILGRKIIILDRELKSERLLSEAKSASARDDWKKSFQLYESAKKIQPNNILAIEGAQLASSITLLQTSISRHLNAPHRLASANIASQARSLIDSSKNLSGRSNSLDTSLQSLRNLILSYSTKASIKVVSDGLTKVSVRRVGRVGIIKEKIIKLKPGEYTFEGTRSGYRSKLVHVSIRPGIKDYKVEVICNEPI
jgi:tetratricopeptide (TPR) repeat protein